MTKKLLLCDCLNSQAVDGDLIASHTQLKCSKVYTSLCTDQIDAAAREIASGDVIVACQQERARFEELASEIEAEIAGFVDLRDRAGWSDSDNTASTGPKMAALAAEAVGFGGGQVRRYCVRRHLSDYRRERGD